MKINFNLHTKFGVFESDILNVTVSQYTKLYEMSKTYYDGDYEMFLPDGFLVASPDVLKDSILIIKILEKDVIE
jgi:hypothetical protein